jgi:hypothetical protein
LHCSTRTTASVRPQAPSVEMARLGHGPASSDSPVGDGRSAALRRDPARSAGWPGHEPGARRRAASPARCGRWPIVTPSVHRSSTHAATATSHRSRVAGVPVTHSTLASTNRAADFPSPEPSIRPSDSPRRARATSLVSDKPPTPHLTHKDQRPRLGRGRRSQDGALRTVPLCVIPEGAGTVNGVCGAFSGCRRWPWPADVATVQRPQRGEDEQPWGPSRLTQDRQRGTGVGQASFAVVQGQRAAPLPAAAGCGQPEVRVPVISSPRHGGMELCVRQRTWPSRRP